MHLSSMTSESWKLMDSDVHRKCNCNARPHAIDMQAAGASYRMLVPHNGARHSVRPGITGWAQANGLRGEINTADAAMARVEHDIAYIQNFSLLLDLRILAKTIICEFLSGSGR